MNNALCMSRVYKCRSHWPDFRRPHDLIGGGSSAKQTQQQTQIVNMQQSRDNHVIKVYNPQFQGHLQFDGKYLANMTSRGFLSDSWGFLFVHVRFGHWL